MPELPEVETVRRQLEPELVGKRIETAEVLDERLTRPEPPSALEQAVVLDAGDQLDDFFASRLGVEPLSGELTPERLLELAANRKAPLKSFLLTQSRIAGIGNIYADEALWRARLHPLSPAGSMKIEHAERLVEGIVGALQAGLDHGGASIDDYLDARGERGSMQDEFLVHTREGEPCLRPPEEHRPTPPAVIQRIVVSGRSTYFCPNCQERLRRRPRRKVRRRAPRRAGAR